MNNIDCYLKTLIILLIFFWAFIMVFSNQKFMNLTVEDTRYQYPYDPPVNPIVRQSEIVYPQVSLHNEDVFSDYHTVNQVDKDYKLIKIPLQMNVPNDNEQLRSQLELVTDYNKIKYC